MANSVLGKNGKLLEYRHLIANSKTRETWTHYALYGNELGRLAQGMPGQVKGTDTIFFIPRHSVPKERAKDVTYGLITCLIRPEKINEPNRMRLVAGGDRVHYPFDAGTPTADLLTIKLLINSIISTPGARFFTMDIKNQELLLVHAKGGIRVRSIETVGHARRRDLARQAAGHRDARGIRILRNLTRHVRSPTSRNHRPGIIVQKTQGTRVLPKRDHPRTMEARMETHLFLPCR
jgi:hypothetical protein